MSQPQYRNKNQNFISNFVFQFIEKTKWHFRYTDLEHLWWLLLDVQDKITKDVQDKLP